MRTRSLTYTSLLRLPWMAVRRVVTERGDFYDGSIGGRFVTRAPTHEAAVSRLLRHALTRLC